MTKRRSRLTILFSLTWTAVLGASLYFLLRADSDDDALVNGPAVAEVASSSGEVVVRAEDALMWSEAAKGRKLPQGAHLATGASGEASVRFRDGRRLKLGRHTQVVIAESISNGQATTVVSLIKGNLSALPPVVHKQDASTKRAPASLVVKSSGRMIKMTKLEDRFEVAKAATGTLQLTKASAGLSIVAEPKTLGVIAEAKPAESTTAVKQSLASGSASGGAQPAAPKSAVAAVQAAIAHVTPVGTGATAANGANDSSTPSSVDAAAASPEALLAPGAMAPVGATEVASQPGQFAPLPQGQLLPSDALHVERSPEQSVDAPPEPVRTAAAPPTHPPSPAAGASTVAAAPPPSPVRRDDASPPAVAQAAPQPTPDAAQLASPPTLVQAAPTPTAKTPAAPRPAASQVAATAASATPLSTRQADAASTAASGQASARQSASPMIAASAKAPLTKHEAQTASSAVSAKTPLSHQPTTVLTSANTPTITDASEPIRHQAPPAHARLIATGMEPHLQLNQTDIFWTDSSLHAKQIFFRLNLAPPEHLPAGATWQPFVKGTLNGQAFHSTGIKGGRQTLVIALPPVAGGPFAVMKLTLGALLQRGSEQKAMVQRVGPTITLGSFADLAQAGALDLDLVPGAAPAQPNAAGWWQIPRPTGAPGLSVHLASGADVKRMKSLLLSATALAARVGAAQPSAASGHSYVRGDRVVATATGASLSSGLSRTVAGYLGAVLAFRGPAAAFITRPKNNPGFLAHLGKKTAGRLYIYDDRPGDASYQMRSLTLTGNQDIADYIQGGALGIFTQPVELLALPAH